jgi:hypothetical protein
MSGNQTARGGARRETIKEFMARRVREVASLGGAAEAASYEAVKKAIRAGQDYRLMTPGEVLAYGSGLVRRPKTSAVSPTAKAPARAKPRGLDDSATAKAVIGTLAYAAGLAPGAVRGAVHTGESALEAALFAQRLANPLDQLLSPPGQSAVAQASNAGRLVADSVVKGAQDPSKVRDDLTAAFQDFRVKHDPTATAVADTLTGEMKRTFALGMNGGELVFDGGSLLVGGAAIQGAAGLGKAAKAAGAVERAQLAARPGLAASFERSYPKSGMSHHIVERAAKLPAWLGGGHYPRWLTESEFNKIRHDPGITVRDLYRNHVGAGGIDHFRGGPVGRAYGGGGWSARTLGWDTYGPLDRLNYGTSPYTKAVVGPVLIGGTAEKRRQGGAP